MRDRDTFDRLGYWSALVCGAGALGYGAVSIAVAVVVPSALTWEGYDRYAAAYSPWPTLAVLAPPFVVSVAFPFLVLALYAAAAEARRPFALLGLVLAGAYTAVLGGAYWLQLTNVPWNILRGATDGIAPWVIWNPASFFWSLETFAYFVMGLSCVCCALAFEREALPRGIRRGLLAMGLLGVYFLSTAAKDVLLDPGPNQAWVTVWSLSAAFAWVALFGSVSLALARWFARARSRAAPSPDGGDANVPREESTWRRT
jgi:hypothetical protein